MSALPTLAVTGSTGALGGLVAHSLASRASANGCWRVTRRGRRSSRAPYRSR